MFWSKDAAVRPVSLAAVIGGAVAATTFVFLWLTPVEDRPGSLWLLPPALGVLLGFTLSGFVLLAGQRVFYWWIGLLCAITIGGLITIVTAALGLMLALEFGWLHLATFQPGQWIRAFSRVHLALIEAWAAETPGLAAVGWYYYARGRLPIAPGRAVTPALDEASGM